MKNINELSVGDETEFNIYFNQDIHERFKREYQDTSLVHNDDLFAQKAGFKEKIAYGFNIISYFSRFYGNYLPGGSSICLKQSVKFIKPIYLNDTIKISGKIININQSLKIITIKNKVTNQNGDVCISGEGIVKIVI